MNLTMLPPHGVILVTILSAIVWLGWEVIMFPLWLSWHEQMDAAERAAPALPDPPTVTMGGDGRLYQWEPEYQRWLPGIRDTGGGQYRLVTDRYGQTTIEPAP